MLTRLQALRNFLNSSPPTLTLAGSGSKSKSTRGPTAYDTHFPPEIQIRRLVYLPDLLDYLLGIVDDKMKTIRSSQIPFSTETLDNWHDKYQTMPSEMTDEASVMNFYNTTTASVCAQLASWLEFGTHSRDNIFRWTPDKKQREHAIYDGALKVDEDAFKRCRSSLSAGAREDIETVLSVESHMAPWEAKSLSAAKEELIRAIVEYAQAGGSFCWTCCDSAFKCGRCHHSSNEPGASMNVTGARMGFDAPCPYELPNCKKRKRDEDQSYVRKELWEKIHSLLQQIWAEGVKLDSTYMILHSGNQELICFRHRATGTLYVSRMIKPATPGYVKLHIGLYLAIWRDAVVRAKMWVQAKAQGTLPVQYGLDTEDDRDLVVRQRQGLFKAAQSNEIIEAYYKSRDPGFSWPGAVECSRIEDNGLSVQASSSRGPRLRVILGDLVNPGILRVHKATLEMPGVSIRHCAVVTIVDSSSPDRSKIIGNELKIWTHLKLKGVDGCIPVVLGLFEMSQYPYVLLLTTHNGLSLPQRKKRHHDCLTEEQRSEFDGALSKIHDAGVLHGPICADDLLVDGDGHVSITGFSSAKISVVRPKRGNKQTTPSYAGIQKKKDVERSQLTEILRGY